MRWGIIIQVHNVNCVEIFSMDVQYVVIVVLLLLVLHVYRACFSMELFVVIVILHVWHVLLNLHVLHVLKDLLYQ